jgi:hypothetical protein
MTLKKAGVGTRSCSTIISKKTICKKVVTKKRIVKPVRFRKSAFRTVSGSEQLILNGVFAKVKYQVQELDLNNEYNSATSTFRPKQNGIYSLFASVSFETITLTPVTFDLQIRINGVPRISDQENFTPRTGIISTAGIINLKARDRVEVFARSTGENGEIQSGLATRFEGARIS